ncbi:MAG TPA: alpha/beta fold hydrolase, partial [Solirubrobacteraceae bacterium]
MAATHHAPEPPVPLPPGRIIHVPGRGELFVRDSGGDGPAVLLLHGWMFPSDLNWFPVYGALADEGYRVLAMDHRGHGRGLRTSAPFRLTDCAADAAALVEHLGCGPVTAVGYSMGGPIATLMSRAHRQAVRGVVLCATSTDWQGKRMSVFWKTMASIRFWLGLAPAQFWKLIVRGSGIPAGPEREWVAAELSRGSSVDIAEAGRELSRYDARPWIEELRGLPAAVVVTARDRSVPPRKQRALAEALGARTFDVKADHMAVVPHKAEYRRALIVALESVGAGAGA